MALFSRDRGPATRRLVVGCEFTYEAEVPTLAVFQVQPDDSDLLNRRSEFWVSTPELKLRSYRDSYGNPCTRVMLPAGWSSLRYEANLDVVDAVEEFDESAQEVRAEDLPDDVLLFTLPSRYCLPDELGDEAWELFGVMDPGYGRVQAICDYVHNHLTFQYGSTSALSTAADVNVSGFGVCRDFTHLAISFCRALNIPARYVFGYIPEMDVHPSGEPMDFAAWMEVWLDDRWWTFDPRNNVRRKGRTVVGRGRDASDVAMATTFGGPRLNQMTVTAEEIG
jgi:transglutaminase-like putative cysteine protease